MLQLCHKAGCMVDGDVEGFVFLLLEMRETN